jgi:hypothetical protein
MKFSTPILFLVFNRPDTTKQVFEAISKVKPSKLFVAADGPRLQKEGEKQKCEAVRNIATQINWDCELVTLFREENLGCGKAVSEAITWFFEHVEEGIILEDDCLPAESFFYYCTELLHMYRNDEKIMHIGGSNFQNGKKRGRGDYYFSSIPHICGWATWKSAWDKYDFTMNGYYDIKCIEILKKYYKHNHIIDYWINIFNSMSKGIVDTWDYQWYYTILESNGMSISPNINLVSNIGFGINATHTIEKNKLVSDLPISELKISNHPNNIIVSKKADEFTYKYIYGIVKPKNWYDTLYISYKIKKILFLTNEFKSKLYKLINTL